MLNNVYISDNFKLSEFQSKDTKEVKIDEKLIIKLEILREVLSEKAGKEVPLIVNSGYRTPEYNKKVGGAPQSQHVEGKAADIALRTIPFDIDEVAEIAEEIGFDGIGKYDTFIHLDVRGYPARW